MYRNSFCTRFGTQVVSSTELIAEFDDLHAAVLEISHDWMLTTRYFLRTDIPSTRIGTSYKVCVALRDFVHPIRYTLLPMNLRDLDFSYPEHLVATERLLDSRVMWVRDGIPEELSLDALLGRFTAGDVLVINDTKVLRRRIFSDSGLEILFLDPEPSPEDRLPSEVRPAPMSEMAERSAPAPSREAAESVIGETRWRVLCPSSRWKNDRPQLLPGGVSLQIISRGRPQLVEASRPLNPEYFETYGEMPLPPYIQKARGERHNRVSDTKEYQTSWAENPGSLAAPTASLHFNQAHLIELKRRGVQVVRVTLHVGLGTFLPVTVENLENHVMHNEYAEISASTWQSILAAKNNGHKVWALGTTVTRTLEAAASGQLAKTTVGGFCGETGIFIRPGFEFKVIDGLLTNFHQPQSTLFALVSAFSDLAVAQRCYAWAIERGFRLFSYGDLSAWTK